MNRRLREREIQLQQLRLCFEIASYSLANFANVTGQLQKLEAYYKLSYE